MRRRFFVDEFSGRAAILRGEAAHHLGRVLRAESGQLYELSDGKSLWLARTETVGRDEVRFSLVESLPVRSSHVRITLLMAIVKFDRFEWAIEKATELGVDEIVPLATERSEKELLAAASKRAERWQRILTESAQQARRLRVPLLHGAAKPHTAFRDVNAHVRLLLSERAGANPMRELLEPAAAAVGDNATNVAVAIGPEGGWTDAEITAGAAAGFAEAALGVNILRTETAVCAALAAVQYAFGAFRGAGEPQNLQLNDTRKRREDPWIGMLLRPVPVARRGSAWYKINCFRSKDMEPNAEINNAVAPEATQPLRRELGSWGRDLVIALSLAIVIIIFFYQPVKVEGTSMTPLISDQERIFINKFVYRFEPIERGDVVVFWYPLDRSKSFIKRVVGLPDDMVEIREGQVYVNGKYLPEPYVPPESEDYGSLSARRIPDDEYFVMGDHRSSSNDSRIFGPVPRKFIYGKAVFAYWPVDHFGSIPVIAAAGK